MTDHGNKYFTTWCGVYDRRDRGLAFATGGHPPAVMLLGRRRIEKLGRPGLFVGGFPDARCEVQKYQLALSGVACCSSATACTRDRRRRLDHGIR
jgi:serine phosphatase RsbU (regulator of sigma subunit)